MTNWFDTRPEHEVRQATWYWLPNNQSRTVRGFNPHRNALHIPGHKSTSLSLVNTDDSVNANGSAHLRPQIQVFLRFLGHRCAPLAAYDLLPEF
jgi:hypothetical protein